MTVVFTDHAWARCKKRKINPHRLRKQLEGLPQLKNLDEWRFQNGIRVILAPYPDRCVVITVYRRGR